MKRSANRSTKSRCRAIVDKLVCNDCLLCATVYRNADGELALFLEIDPQGEAADYQVVVDRWVTDSLETSQNLQNTEINKVSKLCKNRRFRSQRFR
jgi:hypothetical protein